MENRIKEIQVEIEKLETVLEQKDKEWDAKHFKNREWREKLIR